MKSKYGNIKEYRLIEIWQSMKRRCKDKNNKLYGGRGIKVCQEWENDFQPFYTWSMENGYDPKLSIDRIDVNGDYEPNNCRWTDAVTQSNNKRNNRLITIDGKTQTLSRWVAEYNKPFEVVHQRLRYGWTIKRALLTPVKKRRESPDRISIRETAEELEKLDKAIKKLGYKDHTEWYKDMKRKTIRESKII